MHEKLNILQVTPFFYPSWAYGGIPRCVYELSRAMVRSGHHVTVCTTDVFDERSRLRQTGSAVDVDGVQAFYFPNLSNRAAYYYNVYSPRGILRFMSDNLTSFDIVHLNGHRHLLNNAAHYYAMKYRVPYVMTANGTVLPIERRVATKKVFDVFLGRQILRDAAHFIAVSESEIAQYVRINVPAQRVAVIPNPVDVDSFKYPPASGAFRRRFGLSDRRVVLFLGKITPRKGVDFLIKAFARLKRADAMLVIAGNDMGYRDRLERLVKMFGLESEVVFTGLIDGEMKLAAYVDADVVVYPTVHEIFGLVPFEALMCGTPVIVCDDCGCGEIIGKAGCGELVRYGDVDDLAKKIEKVLAHPEKEKASVERGREFIRANLCSRVVAQQTVDLYRRVLNGDLRKVLSPPARSAARESLS